MFPIVPAAAADELVIVVFELQGFIHLQVAEPPVAVFVIEIIFAVLEEDADGFPVGFADAGGVVVSAADVGEAADVTEHFAEPFGVFPGGSEGTDAATGNATDGPVCRIRGKVELQFGNDVGNEFQLQKPRVLVAESIVLKAAIGSPPAVIGDGATAVAWVDKQADGDWEFTAMNQIVEDHRDSELTGFIDIRVSILKHHQAGWLSAIVLGRDVDRVFAGGVRKDATGPLVFCDLSDGHAILSRGIGAELKSCVGIRRSVLGLSDRKLAEQGAGEQREQGGGHE